MFHVKHFREVFAVKQLHPCVGRGNPRADLPSAKTDEPSHYRRLIIINASLRASGWSGHIARKADHPCSSWEV
jgi:hypothetical protein